MKHYRKLLVEELASKGNKEAIYEMVRDHIYNRRIENLNLEKVEQIKRYLFELAEKNDSDAMVSLGCMYYEGRGVQQNYKEAHKWYEMGAKQLDKYGLCNLGYCYYYGRDIDIDYEKAYFCFSQATYLRNPNAMYKLGDMFYYGYHVEEDKKAAFFWYKEAWKVYNFDTYVTSSIEYRLGRCYLHGHGVEKNKNKALKLLKKAEKGFLQLIIAVDDDHSEIVLKSVREEIDTARKTLSERKKQKKRVKNN